MIRPNTIRLATLVSFALIVLAPSVAAPVDWSYDYTELGVIFEAMGRRGNFKIVAPAVITRCQIDLKLKQVEPLDALRLVSRIHGFHVERTRQASRAHIAEYTIRLTGEQSFSRPPSRSCTIQLRFAKAAALVRPILEGMPQNYSHFSIVRDDKSNRLSMNGSESAIAAAMSTIARLDKPRRQKLVAK